MNNEDQESIKPVVLFETPDTCETCGGSFNNLNSITQTEKRGYMKRENLVGYYCSACETTHLYA